MSVSFVLVILPVGADCGAFLLESSAGSLALGARRRRSYGAKEWAPALGALIYCLGALNRSF